MRHPKLVEFDRKLKALFDSIDDYLEDKYGHLYPLHPARAERGKTSNKGQDGLFNVGVSFSPGYGSTYGRGYVIEVEMVTLANVPDYVREQIEQEVADVAAEKLPYYLPGRKLTVDRDGRLYKIHGDLSLGSL
jgi:glutathione S-transferase